MHGLNFTLDSLRRVSASRGASDYHFAIVHGTEAFSRPVDRLVSFSHGPLASLPPGPCLPPGTEATCSLECTIWTPRGYKR